jgi:hypothetical protein
MRGAKPTCSSITDPKFNFLWNKVDSLNTSWVSTFMLNESLYEPTALKELEPMLHTHFHIPLNYCKHIERILFNASDERLFHVENEYKKFSSSSSSPSRHLLDERKSYYAHLLSINTTSHRRRLAVFHNVRINNYGLIVHPDTCEYVRNGGCVYTKPKKVYRFSGPAYFVNRVISLATVATGTWHFPMEMFVALAAVPMHLIQDSYIHITSMNPFISQWFQLFGIRSDRIITYGNLYAETLYIPEMGLCGSPFPTQLKWLFTLGQIMRSKELRKRSLMKPINTTTSNFNLNLTSEDPLKILPSTTSTSEPPEMNNNNTTTLFMSAETNEEIKQLDELKDANDEGFDEEEEIKDVLEEEEEDEYEALREQAEGEMVLENRRLVEQSPNTSLAVNTTLLLNETRLTSSNSSYDRNNTTIASTSVVDSKQSDDDEVNSDPWLRYQKYMKMKRAQQLERHKRHKQMLQAKKGSGQSADSLKNSFGAQNSSNSKTKSSKTRAGTIRRHPLRHQQFRGNYTIGKSTAIVVRSKASGNHTYQPIPRRGRNHAEVFQRTGQAQQILSQLTGVSRLTPTSVPPPTNGHIIYMYRHRTRVIHNYLSLSGILNQYARDHNYSFVFHDDRRSYGLEDQILTFQDAAMVIAPHGAGLLFTSFVPQHACILELMPTVDYPRCYARIAYLRQVLYYEMILLEDSHRLSEEVLKVHIQHCHQLRQSIR